MATKEKEMGKSYYKKFNIPCQLKTRIVACAQALHWNSVIGRNMKSEPSTRSKDKNKIILSVAKSISFIVCLLCSIFHVETSWSSWRTCVKSDGNLCRCQTRRCQEKGNTPCLNDVEIRLENCTGKLICSLTVVITFLPGKYSRCLLENALYYPKSWLYSLILLDSKAVSSDYTDSVSYCLSVSLSFCPSVRRSVRPSMNQSPCMSVSGI